MIVKFDTNVIVRSSLVTYAYVTVKKCQDCIHILFHGGEWLHIFFNSEEEAVKGLDKLMKAMETDIKLEKKPKKKMPRRKIR